MRATTWARLEDDAHAIACAMPFDLLLPLVIALPRALAMSRVFPMLSSTAVPRLARNACALGLAVFLYPVHRRYLQHNELAPLTWVLLMAKEAFIGALIGYVCAVFIWACQAVGELLDTVVGHDNLRINNPTTNQENGPYAVVLTQIASILFIALGGWMLTVQTLVLSYAVWPVGSFIPSLDAGSLAFFLGESAGVLRLAAQLALPMMAALLMLDLAIGLMNRLAQQLNAHALSMPMKAVLSVLLLLLMLSVLVTGHPWIERWMTSTQALLTLRL
jgi:type III secretion protein T